MSPIYNPPICRACGRLYVVDDSVDIHMEPPGDYRRGYRRFCLACWLGVGPKDCLDTEHEEIEGHLIEASGKAESDFYKRDGAHLHASFVRRFKAEESGVWTDFFDRFKETDGRICYYPSAGSDFRPVIYQQLAGITKLGLIHASGDMVRPDSELGGFTKYAAPDLWICSDFRGDDVSQWLETKLIHKDDRVEIQLLAHTEIHPLRMDFATRPSRAYTSLPPTEMTGRVFYLRISAMNETIGTVDADVIYFCVENVNLIRSFLLRQRIPLSHLVWVRDGAGFGGGRLRHDFLIPLLPLLKTRWLFIEERYHQNLGEVAWPQELRFFERLVADQRPELLAMGSFQSGDDRVVFCEVDSSRVDETVKEIRLPLLSKPADTTSSVYLWLHCEGWMKFGPFDWLRFDYDLGAILGPREEVVAWRDDGGWRTSNPRGADMVFSDPTISSQHAHQNSAFSLRRRERISIDAWREFYDGEFQSLLAGVLRQYPDKSDSPHCRAPNELRVRLPDGRGLRALVPNAVAERFFCCWYGTVLVAQGMHQFIRGCHPAWTLRNFCPLPVHDVGEGSVQVAPSRELLAAKRPSFETWIDFIPFFRQRILGEVEKLTGMSQGEFMAAIRSSRERQDEPFHPLEARLFSSFPPEK